MADRGLERLQHADLLCQISQGHLSGVGLDGAGQCSQHVDHYVGHCAAQFGRSGGSDQPRVEQSLGDRVQDRGLALEQLGLNFPPPVDPFATQEHGGLDPVIRDHDQGCPILGKQPSFGPPGAQYGDRDQRRHPDDVGDLGTQRRGHPKRGTPERLANLESLVGRAGQLDVPPGVAAAGPPT